MSIIDLQKYILKNILPKSLIVVTDMQWNAAAPCNGKWLTFHEKLVKLYSNKGILLLGVPLPLPLMVYWNARGDIKGSPVIANTKGSIFITGQSSGVFKTLMTSGPEELLNLTPWKLLQKTVYNSFYDDANKNYPPFPTVGIKK